MARVNEANSHMWKPIAKTLAVFDRLPAPRHCVCLEELCIKKTHAIRLSITCVKCSCKARENGYTRTREISAF